MGEHASTEIWVERVEAWRASGMRAEVFTDGEDYKAGTLRWWASRLKRQLGDSDPPSSKPAAAATTAPVRIARVVRAAAPRAIAPAQPAPAIVLDIVAAGVRIAVGAGSDRATLAMVLDTLGVRR